MLDTYREEFQNVDSYSDIDFGDDHENHVNNFDQFLEQFETQIETIEQIDALEEMIGESEFNFGVTLIPEHKFVEYAEEYAETIGAIDTMVCSWLKVDWNGTADNLKMDYSNVDYKGVEYLYT